MHKTFPRLYILDRYVGKMFIGMGDAISDFDFKVASANNDYMNNNADSGFISNGFVLIFQ